MNFHKSNHRIIFFLLAIVQFCLPPILWGQTIDTIVATVNGEVIAQSDIQRVLVTFETEYRHEYADQEAFNQRLKELRANLISQMIQEKLVLCEAKKFDFKVDGDKIEQRIGQIKQRFNSEDEFERALEQEGVTLKDLRDRFRDQETMKTTVDYFVKSKINIEPLEITQFYQTHQDEFVYPEKLHLRSIVIKIDDQQTEREALEKAKGILERLKEDADFIDLARAYSQGANAQDGGDLGIIEQGQLIPEIEQVIFGLSPGEYSEVIKTHQGYRIFKVEEKYPSRARSFMEAQEEVRQALYKQKFNAEFTKWIEQLKQNAIISVKTQQVE